MAKAKIGLRGDARAVRPGEVLDLCARADSAGFSGVIAADHFQPWTPAQAKLRSCGKFWPSRAHGRAATLVPA